MNLIFNRQLANKYHSASQAARILTENWFETNMFCPRCGHLHVSHFENNRPVADFYCPICNSEFELKSTTNLFRTKINDGAYSTMIHRITHNNNPDLFCMRYETANYSVTDLIFVPKFFFTPGIIEKRKPLKETARRAGWTGCNILIGQIPKQAQIEIVSNGTVRPVDKIVEQVKKCDSIATQDLTARGWLLDVLQCVNTIKTQEFTLSDVYSFESTLRLKHPNNNNIQAKIRQQLQLLRDKGFIAFLGNGKYVKTGE